MRRVQGDDGAVAEARTLAEGCRSCGRRPGSVNEAISGNKFGMTDQRQERRKGSRRVGRVRKDWAASLGQIEGA